MRAALALVALLAVGLPASAAEPVLLHAAGSLKGVLTDVARRFEAAGGPPVQAKFAPSGLLRDEIAGGAKAQVFASANMNHPRSLASGGKAGPVVLFARNRLCALIRPGLALAPADILDRMLDPGIKLGSSTPKADPSGDYAFEAFAKADALRPGARAALEAKALQLTGGPNSPPAPKDRNLYGMIVETGGADIFLTYCTNAKAALAEVKGASMVDLPDALAVGADYGLTVISGSSEAAYRFALFILSSEAQAILREAGFAAPTLAQ